MMSVFDKGSPAALFAAIAAGAAMKYTVTMAMFQTANKFHYVGKVGEIWCYPIKSLKGLKVDSAEATQLGIKWHSFIDRHWAVSTSDGVYLTQRQEPTMALIEPMLNADRITLRAPGMEPVSFPANPKVTQDNLSKVTVRTDTVTSMDLGDEVAKWLSTFLKRSGLRLHYSAPDMEKRDSANVKKLWPHAAKPGDVVALSDYCSYMLVSNASLKDLNTRLQTPVPISNFRANIVIDDCKPFAEDAWSSVRIGDIHLRALDSCTRCLFTTIDQDKGVKDKNEEPLKTLKTYRVMDKKFAPKPCFGMYFTMEKSGPIKVGDPIYATLA